MSHPLDHHQPSPADRSRGRLPARRPDHLVDGAVDHQRRRLDRRRVSWCGRPRRRSRRAGGHRPRTSKPRSKLRACAFPDVLLVASKPVDPDQPEYLGGALDVAIAVARRGAEQVPVDRERRLAVPAAAGRRHDRGQRADHARDARRRASGRSCRPSRRPRCEPGRYQLAEQAGGVLGHVGERVLLRARLGGASSGRASGGGSRSGSSGRCRGCRSGRRRSRARPAARRSPRARRSSASPGP